MGLFVFIAVPFFLKSETISGSFFPAPRPLHQFYFSFRHIFLVISEVWILLRPTKNSFQSSLLKHQMSVLGSEILHDE